MTPESTDLAGLRQQLDVAARKLAEAHKMASLGRLSAGIVHEINSPIGSILSNNEVILRSLEKLKQMLAGQDQSNAAMRKALDFLNIITGLSQVDQIACERILGIVRSLKTFARVNESDLVRVSVNELIRNTMKLAGTLYRSRITFECNLAEPSEIECYPGLLNQVFLNLVVNACQAIPGEGTVTVLTEPEGVRIHIAISDNGTGIPPEVRPKIFAAGFTTKPLGEGTGLGLTITREIIEDTHGGQIGFDTEVGLGTTFHIRLPVEQPRSEASHRSTN